MRRVKRKGGIPSTKLHQQKQGIKVPFVQCHSTIIQKDKLPKCISFETCIENLRSFFPTSMIYLPPTMIGVHLQRRVETRHQVQMVSHSQYFNAGGKFWMPLLLCWDKVKKVLGELVSDTENAFVGRMMDNLERHWLSMDDDTILYFLCWFYSSSALYVPSCVQWHSFEKEWSK